MLAFPPSYSLPVLLVFTGFVLLFLYTPARKLLRPSRVIVLALVVSLICIPVYSIDAQQVSAYYVGDVVLRWDSMNFTIGPNEIQRIDNISNIHTIAAAYLTIDCDKNVTFYLADQNRPEVHYSESNYSNQNMIFVLPYLYTDEGVPARWSVCLLNPNPSTLNVTIEPIWVEDSIEMAWWSVEFNLYLPLALLFAVLVALGGPLMIIHRKHWASREFGSGLLLVVLGIGIGVVLTMTVPLFVFFPSPLALFLFFLLSILILEKREKTPQKTSANPVESSG
jgi:hypothetical protein